VRQVVVGKLELTQQPALCAAQHFSQVNAPQPGDAPNHGYEGIEVEIRSPGDQAGHATLSEFHPQALDNRAEHLVQHRVDP
jgi:hypothetical protein